MDSGSDAAAQARKEQQEREGRIKTGMGQIDEAFKGFTPGFYDRRQQDYINYATPDVNQQFVEQNKHLGTGLGSKGLLVSSTAQNMHTSLNNELKKQQRGVADAGLNQAQQLQSGVNNAKMNLVSQLQSTADPASASRAALTSASQFSAPSAFAPVGNLFGNWAQIYAGSQLGSAYNAGAGQQQNQYPMGMFGQPRNSSGALPNAYSMVR